MKRPPFFFFPKAAVMPASSLMAIAATCPSPLLLGITSSSPGSPEADDSPLRGVGEDLKSPTADVRRSHPVPPFFRRTQGVLPLPSFFRRASLLQGRQDGVTAPRIRGRRLVFSSVVPRENLLLFFFFFCASSEPPQTSSAFSVRACARISLFFVLLRGDQRACSSLFFF